MKDEFEGREEMRVGGQKVDAFTFDVEFEELGGQLSDPDVAEGVIAETRPGALEDQPIVDDLQNHVDAFGVIRQTDDPTDPDHLTPVRAQ